MNPQILLVIFLLLLVANGETYQLEFDWKFNTLSSGMEVCKVIWNEDTVSTLQEKEKTETLHHEAITIDFKEGINMINFFFIGMKGEVTIDNVAIIKPPKTINFLVNGDFEMPSLGQSNFSVFQAKIPGWKSSKIGVAKVTDFVDPLKKTQALQLNNQRNQISQIISFGKFNKYSFTASIKDDIQKSMQEIIKKNMEKLNSSNWTAKGDIASIPKGASHQINAEHQNYQQLVEDSHQSIADELMQQFANLAEKSMPALPPQASPQANPSGLSKLPQNIAPAPPSFLKSGSPL
jgi:hypothetical protein